MSEESGFKKYIRSQFGNPRGLFGHLVGKAMEMENRDRVLWAVDELGLSPGMNVLEIGFGPGIGLEKVCSIDGIGKVYGIERSSLMVKKAKRRNKSSIKNGKLIVSCCENPPYQMTENSIHCIYAVNILHHVENSSALFDEIDRLLADGGIVSFTDQPHFGREIEDELPSTLMKARESFVKKGYSVEKVTHMEAKPAPCYSVQLKKRQMV